TERDNRDRRRCLLGNSGCDITVGQNDVHIHADEFGGSVWKLLTLFGIAELDCRILAVNEAQLPQSLTERFQTRRSRGRSAGPQDADTRNTLGCCAPAASGHAAAAPPSSVMNVRRFIFVLIRSPRRRGRAASGGG